MRRMNQRLAQADHQHHCRPWSLIFAKNQWYYVSHLLDGHPLLWTRKLLKFNVTNHHDHSLSVHRHVYIGRPRMRWDDHNKGFCRRRWPDLAHMHWFDVLKNVDMYDFLDEYLVYIAEVRAR